MNDVEIRELHAAVTGDASGGAVATWREGHQQYRLLAMMVQGTAGALPEAWRSYPTVDTARSSAREMLDDERVLQVAIVEDRPKTLRAQLNAVEAKSTAPR
jgi:hypothetical protein